jgi:Protein of unknown function (DUF3631)
MTAPAEGSDSSADQLDEVPDESGEHLLDDLVAFLTRFVVFPVRAHAVAIALWILHGHALDAFESTPRLAFLSPEPASGKTRSLELLALLVPRPAFSSTMTPAVMFRRIDRDQPTILLDEVDAVFTPGHENQELRALINTGHRRGATADRCIGDGARQDLKSFSTFAAMVLAGLRDLPTTIADRSVIVRMKRRAPNEEIEQFRRRRVEPEAEALRRRLAAWASRHVEVLRDADPLMPDGIADRAADMWEPLLAIADAAGGRWPELARTSALALTRGVREGAPSVGVTLLAACRAAFAVHGGGQIPTNDLLAFLNEPETAPWAKWNDGSGIDPRDLARCLKTYEIHPKKLREGPVTPRGYRAEDFSDAWSRYDSARLATAWRPDADWGQGIPAQTAGTGGTPEQPFATTGADVPQVPDVPHLHGGQRGVADDLEPSEPHVIEELARKLGAEIVEVQDHAAGDGHR